MSRSFHGNYYKKQEWYPHHWRWKEPKWWRKLYKHRVRRREWQQCYSKIKKGYDLEDMVYPLDTKPWMYYW